MKAAASDWLLERVRAITGAIPWLVLLVAALLCPLALAWVGHESWTWIVFLAAILLTLYVPLPNVIRFCSPSSRLESMGFWFWAGVGVALRMSWILFVEPFQQSDFLSYVESARELVAGNGYSNAVGDHRLLAFRPPGESFLIAAAIAVIGDRWWTPAAVNILLYVISACALYQITILVSSERRAIGVSVLFAIWPSGIMITGLAASETTSLALWLSLLLCVLVVQRNGNFWSWSVGAGIALGAGILVRPSKLLAIPMLTALASFTAGRSFRALAAASVIAVVAIAVVLPWSYRNYQVLGAIVPVSTNGGDVFYRANNPIASGAYTPAGELDFSYLLPDEVAWNKASMRAGLEWVRQHPIEFAELGLRKLLITLGSDGTGAYWSLARVQGIDDHYFQFALLISNAWWYFVWALVFGSVLYNHRYFIHSADGRLLTSFASYFFVIHMVFESQPRYHMPAIGPILVIAALWSPPRLPVTFSKLGDALVAGVQAKFYRLRYKR